MVLIQVLVEIHILVYLEILFPMYKSLSFLGLFFIRTILRLNTLIISFPFFNKPFISIINLFYSHKPKLHFLWSTNVYMCFHSNYPIACRTHVILFKFPNLIRKALYFFNKICLNNHVWLLYLSLKLIVVLGCGCIFNCPINYTLRETSFF